MNAIHFVQRSHQMRQSPTSPLNAAVQDAGRMLAALHMTEIRGTADTADAASLLDDIDAICGIVDLLIEKIGDYACAHFGVSPQDHRRYFKDQLSAALQGNATFAITDAAEQAEAYLRETVR